MSFRFQEKKKQCAADLDQYYIVLLLVLVVGTLSHRNEFFIITESFNKSQFTSNQKLHLLIYR